MSARFAVGKLENTLHNETHMDGIQIRRMLVVAFLVTASLRSAYPQVSTVQKFQIHMTDPAYARLPTWIYAESSFPSSIVYQCNVTRDPLVLTGVVLAMALLGSVATWIPAQRALSIDPAILLREE